MTVTLRKLHRPENLRIVLAISRIHPVSQRRTPLMVTISGVLIVACLGVATWLVQQRFPQPPAAPVSANAGSVSPVTAQPSDPGLLLESGREFARHKEWARAERAYHAVLQASPRNREAIVGLSDVLYAQHKYEESAAVLNQLSMVSGYGGRVD